MTKVWAIYGLYAPDEMVVRYIGFTRRLRRRLGDHVSRARTGGRLRVSVWIREILERGLLPVLTVLEQGEGDDWEAVEQYWIHRFQGPKLLNMTRGGGASYVPEEARRRAGEKLKSRVFTPEHRQRISDAKLGCRRPDVVARNKAAAGVRHGPLRLSEDERRRRVAQGHASIGVLRAWCAGMTEEQRKQRSEAASQQMKRVWRERRGGNE